MNALDLLYFTAAVTTAPWWTRKARGGWRERFGHTPPLTPAPINPPPPRLLIHAVSVGEVNTLRSLVPMLRDAGVEVVVASTTDTGLARARAIFETPAFAADPPHRAAVRVVRYPLDFSASVRRFLDAVRPDAVALVELEVWPNFLRECERRGIPAAVINGRLSAKSFRGYCRFRRILAPSFSRLAFAAVQDAAYAQRFRHMGVADVRITGSMKWDTVPSAAAEGAGPLPPEAEALSSKLGIDRSRPLVVAGSTGPTRAGSPSEEALLHLACPEGVQLLCAPRRPERFDEAYAALGGAERCVRRSRPDQRPAAPHRPDRFLLDSIGELRAAYALADVAVVGRSFGNLRGSDPIEPVALGKATLMGPDFRNFESIVGALKEAEAIEICQADSIGSAIARLIADPERQRAMAAAGRRCIEQHRGATAAHARMLLDLVAAGPRGRAPAAADSAGSPAPAHLGTV